MSKTSPRAQTGATKPTTLRASAKPLNASATQPEPGEMPAHTEPFKAFDWMDGADHVDPATRSLVNDAINISRGVSLVLRMVEQCSMAGDFSPQVVVLEDGLAVEQPDAPYLNPDECAALTSFAATAAALLHDRAHEVGDMLRRSVRVTAERTDC